MWKIFLSYIALVWPMWFISSHGINPNPSPYSKPNWDLFEGLAVITMGLAGIGLILSAVWGW